MDRIVVLPVAAALALAVLVAVDRGPPPEQPAPAGDSNPAVPAPVEPPAPELPVFFQGDLSSNNWFGADRLEELRAMAEADPGDAIVLSRLASEHLRVGHHDEAYALCLTARDAGRTRPPHDGFETFVTWRLALSALRKAESENCVARHFPESCIFPLRDRAVHVSRTGAERAKDHLLELLDRPDLDPRSRWRSRWLLNVVATALDAWPAAVPEPHRLPYDPFEAEGDVGAFLNVAREIGIEGRFVADGGIVVDDFDGDERLDVVTCGWLPTAKMQYWRNDGRGGFVDRTAGSGLEDQRGGIDLYQADYDNDGALDLLVVRGAQPDPGDSPRSDDGRLARVSLLHNRGDGTFEDRTVESGLGDHAPWSCAAWGDYDGDGRIDLYLGTQSDYSRYRDRLLRNRGDGTFENVGWQLGLTNGRHAMAAVWGDYDGDGRPDLYIANYGSIDRLFRNLPGGFADVAPGLGLYSESRSQGAWFLDADDDGRLDLLVTPYGADPGEAAADLFSRPIGGPTPRLLLYRGSAGYVDSTAAWGLDRVFMAWSGNAGDVDQDGRVDFYLGTGGLGFEALFPNVLLRSDGRRFEDVTTAAGVGHLQKASGVAFGDLDGDGAPEILVRAGGCYPSDGFVNVVFRNPGHGRHWLAARLEGRRSNRAAIGARIEVHVVAAGGERRTIRHWVSSGGSHGSSTLRAEIGLADATGIESVEVAWPGGATETFRDVPLDSSVRLVEGTGAAVRAPAVRSPAVRSPAVRSQ